MKQVKAAFLWNPGESQMDIRFKILAILRTINTKPPKSRNDAELFKAKAICCLLSALFFFPVSIYSFRKAWDIDGILFLALALKDLPKIVGDVEEAKEIFDQLGYYHH